MELERKSAAQGNPVKDSWINQKKLFQVYILMAKAFLASSDVHGCRKYYYKANALHLKHFKSNVAI